MRQFIRFFDKTLLFTLVVVLLASQLGYSQDASDEQLDIAVLMRKGTSALASQEWQAATSAFEQVVKADKENGRGWHLLGYSLHLEGKIDEAIPIHEKAAEYEQFEAISLYNLGCAYSLKGRNKKSLDCLHRALDAGFTQFENFKSDSDLNNVRKAKEYTAILERAENDGDWPSRSAPDTSGADSTEEVERLLELTQKSWTEQDWTGGKKRYRELREAWNGEESARSFANHNVPKTRLLSVDSVVHDLAALDGQLVVLEWINFNCPTVNRYYDSGKIAAARKRMDGKDLVWLAVDSSATCDLNISKIREWRTERELDCPYLLDPGGELGRKFGATNTPHFFVMNTSGSIVYQGAWDSPDGSVEYVVEAISALRQGREIETAESAPRGCTVKYELPKKKVTNKEKERNR